MEEKIEQLKDLLWVLNRRHNVSISKTQEDIDEIAERIVKLFAIHDVSDIEDEEDTDFCPHCNSADIKGWQDDWYCENCGESFPEPNVK
jgi:tRNA(Ile2) C34 agmatinyltransferase TiaS